MTEQSSTRPNLRQALELAGGHFLSLVEMGVLQAFVDFGVFDILPDTDESMTIVELATCVPGSEEDLLERFSAYLVAAEILTSAAPGRIAHTLRSRAYCTGQLPAGFIVHLYNFLLHPVACWTSFFDHHGLVAPRQSTVNPLGLATGHPDKDLYGILQVEPQLAKLFDNAMDGSAQIYSLDGVYNFSWMQPLLLQDTEGLPTIVDVGGSSGGALLQILETNPSIPAARCAIFDLPQALEPTSGDARADAAASVQMISGSMFGPLPQAVRGALVYHLRRVLNDFPDSAVLQALRVIREACRSDLTSRVLIVEELLHPNRSKFSIAQDIFVMNFGGKRRSVDMFRALAESSGFKINTVLEDSKSQFGVVELVTV